MKTRLASIALVSVAVLGGACQKGSDTKNGTVKASSSTTTTTAAPTSTTSGKAATSTTARQASTTTTAKATTSTTARAATTTTTTAATVSYANCTAVKNAGKAPLYAGQPGYSTSLDRDRDGVACE